MNAICAMRSGLEGWFTIKKKNASTGEEVVVTKFKNLILDNGLNGIGTNGTSWVSNVYLSTGTSTPSVSDTSMQVTGSAISKGSPSSSSTTQNTTLPYWTSVIWSYTFAQGAATGNWTEVGIGPTVSNLWSRELIRSPSGSPITLTVLAIDILTIEYELRVYYNENDVTGTINISGSNYDYIIRPYGLRNDAASYMVSGSWMSSAFSYSGSCAVWNGALNQAYTAPGGTNNTNSVSSMSVAPYVSASYTKVCTFNYGITGANLSGGITVVAPFAQGDANNGGVQPFKCGFTPAIPKDNTKQLSLTFSFTWGRITP